MLTLPAIESSRQRLTKIPLVLDNRLNKRCSNLQREISLLIVNPRMRITSSQSIIPCFFQIEIATIISTVSRIIISWTSIMLRFYHKIPISRFYTALQRWRQLEHISLHLKQQQQQKKRQTSRECTWMRRYIRFGKSIFKIISRLRMLKVHFCTKKMAKMQFSLVLDSTLSAILQRKLVNSLMTSKLISRQRRFNRVGGATKVNMEILVLGSKQIGIKFRNLICNPKHRARLWSNSHTSKLFRNSKCISYINRNHRPILSLANSHRTDKKKVTLSEV